MKIEFRGSFFYIYSNPECVNEISAEEWIGLWKNCDETKRTEIIHTESIAGVDVYSDQFEIHIYLRGRKTPRQFKMATQTGFQQVLQTLQSGLNFDLT
jgi:hypothetical protein